jgi:hypothetical protein
VITYFDELGRHLDQTWRARGYDEEVFAEIAVAAVVESPAHEKVSFLDILRLLGSEAELPLQMRGGFGEPPVTLFRTERFYIEALHWLDGTTAIHQHGFSGAFHLLEGSSLHCSYRFRREEGGRLNANLMGGELSLHHAELLRRGDTRAIHEGSRSIHSLFHLDQPTVTIVVRTIAEPSEPQYNFQKPGLAHNPFARTARATRLVESLRFLHELRHPELVAMARDHVLRAESLEAYLLVEKMFGCLDEEGFGIFLEAVVERHPILVPILARVFDVRRRERRVLARRKKSRDEGERFFLALILGVDGWEDVLRLVAERYAGQEPARRVLDWTRRLSPSDEDVMTAPLADLVGRL